MLVANLTRYDQDRDCDCGQTCMSGMCEYPDGEYVKFEEAVEASSNSIQQLKAEIATLLSKLPAFELGDGCWPPHFYHFIEELRQLSDI